MITPLAPEYEALKQRVDDFFHSGEWSAEHEDFDFCRRMVKEMGNAGLLEFVAPAASVKTLCFLRYSIAQHSGLSDALFAMQGLGSYPVSLAGTDDQKKKYLHPVLTGDLVSAFAMTEPQAGSDAGAMSLKADKKADGYILNGKKTLISNAGLADFYTLFARTSEGSRGVTAFILDGNTKGISVRNQILIAAHPIGELEFRDCFIPTEQRLGNEGEGLKIAYTTLDVFRPSVAAAATGMAQRAFQEAIAYAKKRKQFGKYLAEFQGIQFKIAEMAQQLQASKLLIWDAASRKDSGQSRITLEAAMAKSFAAEAAQQIIDEALQIHGGVGLLRNSITERLYRDIRALRIYEGTTEILKSIIAHQILQA